MKSQPKLEVIILAWFTQQGVWGTCYGSDTFT